MIEWSVCDSPACIKATGGLDAPFVTVAYGNVTVTSGETTVYKAEGGEGCDQWGVWHFCAHCGCKLYWEPNDHAQIDLFAGTLDDRSVFSRSVSPPLECGSLLRLP